VWGNKAINHIKEGQLNHIWQQGIHTLLCQKGGSVMKKILFMAFLLVSLMVCLTSSTWASGLDDFNACLTVVSRENYDEAIRLCTNAIASGELSREKLSLAYEVLGIAWYSKKEYDKAIADYTKAIESNPRSDEAYYNRGNAWYDKGDYTKAIADYTKVIEINPKDALAYHCRGDAWEKKGNHAKAKADYAKAKELGYK
jgi:tetratricopeptide (TPR) repeat protein